MQRLFTTLVFIFVAMRAAVAQDDVVWVQIEARPSLAEAQDRARAYAAELPDVNGFSLGGGWYGIVLGPYTRGDAQQVLRVYRAEGSIPNDSFIAFSRNLGQQFWPIGANALNRPVAADPAAPRPEVQAETADPDPAPQITPAEETPREARASEALLSRAEREELQVALKWAGFYTAAIDGAFGRGTRASMAQWQQANNFEATGVLTTQQRAVLMQQYNAVLDGLGLREVRDDEAGIEIALPTEVVTFEEYEYPFAHYTASGDLPATVLLISQKGDRDSLYGLYDIMQTLEIVPPDGPRNREGDSFVLIGEAADFISHTEARLERGEIKGFTLVWPAGDEERRTRLLGEMQKSLTRFTGTLAPDQIGDEQSVDLVAGLEVRKPKRARSGFFIDREGSVVTAAEAVDGCARITLDDGSEADILSSDPDLGVAVLAPQGGLAPLGVATFQDATPRLQSEVAVAGYSYGGLLGAPTVTFGTLADLRGLQGEETRQRLTLSTLPGDTGGPVVDAGGAVLGVLLPRDDAGGGRALPDDVNFAANGRAIRGLLDQLGLPVTTTDTLAPIAPESLTTKAGQMTVLVNCWD
ncbi:serine protease [Lutimaribacter sp. EGI FJ00015]|uniref:Serine protease n=1 Tax=Lutimaribacter degradans TaxID=2945989 RepID=A0ACC5ZQW6_9RHOB|nr:serine protease [Lutimaribacter sp. EGI FJ00013]MCM2560708.1 serine protease [Lutimaribacter sp. EGI FJ00013]MCO0612347.1 serine protease [Lutimaribacter sp. EGI FJ00015]MCO0634533.1 serine protease [Lutimaribacter sp. EGI FJ00014]